MKLLKRFALISAFIYPFSLQCLSQNLSDLSFGSDSTFDVVTWNIEWFPKNETITPDSVGKIIESLNADIIGIQEIDDTTLFRKAINKLSKYELLVANGYFGGLVYVYNMNTVKVDSLYKILDSSPFWNALPRSPLVVELTYDDQQYVLINNHFKCCGDGQHDQGNPNDEEARRFEASTQIKKHIDENLPSTRVIVLGDLNDILIDKPQHNVFQMFLDDSANYMFADEAIAISPSSEWSYPGWPSHLDHILISDELFDDFSKPQSNIETIKVENFLPGGWSDYDNYISDHRPVGMNLMVKKVSTGLREQNVIQFEMYPNPTEGHINVHIKDAPNPAMIKITDLYGNIIYSQFIQNQVQIEIDFEAAAGIYLLVIELENRRSVKRLMKK